MNRDQAFDGMRGLAILLMIASNVAPHSLAYPHPLWVRCLGSLAAPLFIFLAGYFASGEKHSMQYYFKRGGAVIFFGMVLDTAIWFVYPFNSPNVLYLIGVGLIYAAFLSRLSIAWASTLCLFSFALGPIMQEVLGYQAPFFYVYLQQSVSDLFQADVLKTIIRQWLFEGTFPLFPWLGFAGLGVLFRKLKPNFKTSALLGFFLTIAGLASLLVTNLPMLVKHGIVEIFYPPAIPYLLIYSGLTIIIFAFRDVFRQTWFRPIAAMGQASLFIYLLHLAIIYWFINKLGWSLGVLPYLGIWFLLSMAMIVIAYILNSWKKGKSFDSLMLRLLLGK
jgi:uncharacterized membrane protein